MDWASTQGAFAYVIQFIRVGSSSENAVRALPVRLQLLRKGMKNAYSMQYVDIRASAPNVL